MLFVIRFEKMKETNDCFIMQKLGLANIESNIL
jgi:hypothetical protein